MARFLFIDTRKIKAALKLLAERVGNAVQGRDALLRGILAESVAKTKERLASQGNGSWKNLSELTAERTGRTKANLAKHSARIKGRVHRGQAEVYFDARGLDWNMSQHDQGYEVGDTVATMKWRLAGGGMRFLTERNAFDVPARRVWLGREAAARIANKHAERWARATERAIR